MFRDGYKAMVVSVSDAAEIEPICWPILWHTFIVSNKYSRLSVVQAFANPWTYQFDSGTRLQNWYQPTKFIIFLFEQYGLPTTLPPR